MNQPDDVTPEPQRCGACGATCLGGKRFCADCGTLLKPSASDIVALVDQRLKEKLQDQAVVEVQIAQALAARAAEWGKLFGLFIAVPLGILVIVLGLLGVKQYSDFVRIVDSRKQELTEQIKTTKATFDEAAKSANTAKVESAKLNSEIAQLQKEIEQTEAVQLRKSVDEVSRRIANIERRFKVDSRGVSPDLQSMMTKSLSGFADYLERIGFDTKSASATVKVDPSLNGNTYYSIQEKKVVVGTDVASLLGKEGPSMILWPYMQHVLLIAARSETVKDSADEPAAALLNAFPDYFVSSYLNNPLVGEGFPGPSAKGYLRNLDNELKFSEQVIEPHEVGEIWAGAFWKVRLLLGRDAADRMFCSTWKSLRRAELTDRSGAAFARKLLSDVGAVDNGKVFSARALLEARGLKF